MTAAEAAAVIDASDYADTGSASWARMALEDGFDPDRVFQVFAMEVTRLG